ncbi:hypothetical protein F8O04_04175 [Pseudoclavibacter endophyticus]|uniref:Uncharacterized protein n=1 Tax=Pseudoclavibacter endophyticus TaxID=1778590 RepID=A0A6H9WS94_9MICO|nr:hypothetical protein F8O04_04175 [Pseudoclavibacter endophyticus]
MTRALVTAASVGYAANVAFGTAVASGAIDNRRIRWVHHALFVATATLTALAITAGAIARRPAAFALAPSAAPLAALPFVGGSLRRHALVGGAAAPAFAAALVLAWRRY